MKRCRITAWLSLPLAALLLGGCPRFQQGPVAGIAPEANMVRIGRERIFVNERGRQHGGSALLLLHGYGSAHDAWARIVPALARRHRVLAVDLPGFGRSDKYAGDYSPAGLAKKLLALLDKKGVRQVHVIGHSWGSSIALALALRAPKRVRSLTLMGAWVFEEQLPAFIRWSRAKGVGEALYTLFYGQRIDDRMALAFYDPEPFVKPKVIDAVKRSLQRPGAIRAALEAARQQRFAKLQKRYPEVKQPTLLLWGKQDRVALLEYGHRLEKLLPNATLAVIDRCGHIPALERPKRVLRRLLPFLAAQGHFGKHAPKSKKKPLVPTSRPAKRPPASRPVGG